MKSAAPRPAELDPAVYKTLLESTRAIPWKIDWRTMKFAYIGPQIEALLGWPQDSWVTVEDWASRMHPDDRKWVVDYCVAQSQSGLDHEADYRALTSDGRYLWIRDVVHVMREPDGSVAALIGFMFDISERKRTEQELPETDLEGAVHVAERCRAAIHAAAIEHRGSPLVPHVTLSVGVATQIPSPGARARGRCSKRSIVACIAPNKAAAIG